MHLFYRIQSIYFFLLFLYSFLFSFLFFKIVSIFLYISIFLIYFSLSLFSIFFTSFFQNLISHFSSLLFYLFSFFSSLLSYLFSFFSSLLFFIYFCSLHLSFLIPSRDYFFLLIQFCFLQLKINNSNKNPSIDLKLEFRIKKSNGIRTYTWQNYKFAQCLANQAMAPIFWKFESHLFSDAILHWFIA